MAQGSKPPLAQDPRPPRFGPVFVVAVYLLVSWIYILASDSIVSMFVSDPQELQRIQTFKGLTFVAITGLILYFLVKAAVRRAKAFQSKLEASSDKLRQITATVPGIVLQSRLDQHGNWSFPYVSDPIETVFGLTPQQLSRDPLAMFRVLDPRDIAQVNQSIEQARILLGPLSVEFRITTPSGELKWIRSQSVTSRDAEGATVFHSVLTDVTEEKRRDAIREGQSAALRMLISGAPMNQVLDAIALLAEAQSQDMRCTILLVDADARRLRLGAAPSMDPQCARAIDGLPIGPDSGVCGTAAFHNRTVICEDTLEDPLCRSFIELINRYQLRACWSVPIAPKAGRALGTLAFYHSARRRPTESDLKLAGEIADLAAVAIAQRRSETALRESEHRYRQIVETAQEGIWLVDSQWTTTFLNERMAAILGRPSEQVVGNHMREVLGSEGFEAIRSQTDRRNAGHRESIDLAFRRPDGANVAAIFTTNPVLNDTGEFDGALSMVVDITARKRVEASLEKSEERYRMLVSQSHVVIWQLDLPSFRFTYVSDFAQTLLGYPVEAWYQPDFWQNHIHPADRDWATRFCRERTEQGKDHIFEYRMITASGSEVWIRDFVSVVMEGGRPSRLLGALVDITSEKRAQLELRASEERYRSVIEDQTELICRFNSDGAVTFANDAFDRFFGVRHQNPSPTSLFALLGPDGERALAKTVKALSRKSAMGQFEHRISRDLESRRVISWTCRALFDDDGRAIGYQCVGNDITELTEARDELLRINKRQALLLDELDHRVKNSLAGLLSLVTLSEQEARGVDDLASSIRARVQTMAAAHSLLSASHWQSVDLSALLAGLAPGDTPGRVSFGGPPVQIPARQVTALGMIVQELLTNSVKYGGLSREHGLVEVRWSVERPPDSRRTLNLHWTERAGPEIESPIRPRLGLSLINGFARSELGGEAKLAFPREGATHRFVFHLDQDSGSASAPTLAMEPQDIAPGPRSIRA